MIFANIRWNNERIHLLKKYVYIIYEEYDWVIIRSIFFILIFSINREYISWDKRLFNHGIFIEKCIILKEKI